MPRKCSVCEHPKLRAITEDLIRRTPYRALEAAYGISKSSFERHMEHARDALRRFSESEAASNEVAIVVPVLVEMRKLNQRAMRILQQAEDAKDRPTALHAIRECRRNLELIAKLTGELDTRNGEAPGGNVTVTVVYADKALVAATPQRLPEAS